MVAPRPAAIDAAPVMASIDDESAARTRTLAAAMPSVAATRPSPSIVASTSVLILFSAYEPAALIPSPVLLPPPMPTAAAITTASMFCSERASTVSAPLASMLDSSMNARTCDAFTPTLTCFHSVASRYCWVRRSKPWLPEVSASLSVWVGPMYS